jgi:hypothetical protein
MMIVQASYPGGESYVIRTLSQWKRIGRRRARALITRGYPTGMPLQFPDKPPRLGKPGDAFRHYPHLKTLR